MHKFIERMALRNAVNASLQHVAIYKKNVSLRQKEKFRETAKAWLKEFADRYDFRKYDGEQYGDEITRLKNHLFDKHGDIIAKMTIGICQKQIALWLKYLWLLQDKSKKPMYATLDRGIMKAAKVQSPPKWPDIDKIDEYMSIVKQIDVHAVREGYESGAEWEAEAWSDKTDDEVV